MRMVKINGNNLSITNVIDVTRNYYEVVIDENAKKKVEACRKFVDYLVREKDIPVYGVNTGFASMANWVIPSDKTKTLQENLIWSHAAGVGQELPEDVVRAMMLLRANTLAKGHSGVHLKTIHTLVNMLNKKVHPVIPVQGSVGASGDLAPLSHMVLVMIGEGEANFNGKRMSGKQAMKEAGISVLSLDSKEGLALNNGAVVICAIGTLCVYDAEMLLKNACITLAISLEALKGKSFAYLPSVHDVRPHPGQRLCAKNVLRLIKDSKLIDSDSETQDAYSIRCAPQVIGSVIDALNYVRKVIKIEINSATDNPLLFIPEDFDEQKVKKIEISGRKYYKYNGNMAAISCGNFHGEPLAIALDLLGTAISEVGNISERRIARLIDVNLSKGLPSYLVIDPGLNSGFMIPQYTAASLVSENKILSHPASVDSIPTGENFEDHVSMGTISARKCKDIIKNVQVIIGIELLVATQAIDIRNRYMGAHKCDKCGQKIEKGRWNKERYNLNKNLEIKNLGKGTEAAYKCTRKKVNWRPHDQSRVMYEDINDVISLIRNGNIVTSVEKTIGELKVLEES